MCSIKTLFQNSFILNDEIQLQEYPNYITRGLVNCKYNSQEKRSIRAFMALWNLKFSEKISFLYWTVLMKFIKIGQTIHDFTEM